MSKMPFYCPLFTVRKSSKVPEASCACPVGALRLSQDSALAVPDDFRDTEKLLPELARAGFEAGTALTIEIPKDKVNLLNLRNLPDTKGRLFKRRSEWTPCPARGSG